ncbi:MAG: metabolite traffic protein EboE [Planctomycetota bacterium]
MARNEAIDRSRRERFCGVGRVETTVWLGYCTNVHPGETVAEVTALVRSAVARVRHLHAPAGRMGLGLWLACEAVRDLARDQRARERLATALAEERLDVFTLNVFPYGGFHEEGVKGRVYEPSWLDAERGRYTIEAAGVLAALLKAGEAGSMSTLAGAARWQGRDQGLLERIARHLLEVAGALWRLHQESGKKILLALEPEPFTTLETAAESVTFFHEYLFRGAARVLAGCAGAAAHQGEEIARTHLGVCFDTCHHAVAFEDAAAALTRLASAGVQVPKMQISNALEIREPAARPEALERLWEFDEPRFLHQAVALRRDGTLSSFRDLPELRSAHLRWSDVAALRVHFHVPLFADVMAPFTTTRAEMEQAVTHAVRSGLCQHFEVETYTWGVLPEAVREILAGGGVPAGVARELEFAKRLLERASRVSLEECPGGESV